MIEDLSRFIEEHRDEINAAVRDNLQRLDGTPASAVSLLSGMSVEDLDQYGGMPKEAS